MRMDTYSSRGLEIRELSKQLILDFMHASPDCERYGAGYRQADLSRSCGLEWGDYPNATASQQQFWIVGLLRELEKEGKVQRDLETKKWRLA